MIPTKTQDTPRLARIVTDTTQWSSHTPSTRVGDYGSIPIKKFEIGKILNFGKPPSKKHKLKTLNSA